MSSSAFFLRVPVIFPKYFQPRAVIVSVGQGHNSGLCSNSHLYTDDIQVFSRPRWVFYTFLLAEEQLGKITTEQQPKPCHLWGTIDTAFLKKLKTFWISRKKQVKQKKLKCDCIALLWPLSTTYFKFSGLKSRKFVIIYFWKSEVWCGSHWDKMKVSPGLHSFLKVRGENLFPYLSQFLDTCLHSLARSPCHIQSQQLPVWSFPLWHWLFFCFPLYLHFRILVITLGPPGKPRIFFVF